jgi:GDP-L-fucose synthase
MNVVGKRAIVTGGAGLLGRVVVAKLRERGYAEIIVPRSKTCDLRLASDVSQLMGVVRPHFVIHLAATVDNSPNGADAAASFYDNVLMSVNLIHLAAQGGVEKMICLGSASSYPQNVPMPLREEDLFNGLPEMSRAAHGIAKRLPLIHAQACRAQYGLNCIFLIPTNFYGPGDNFAPESSYVIPSLIRKFSEAVETGAKCITVRGSGRATRDFFHVEDCAEAVLLALERYDLPEPVNVASGNEIRISELARLIAELTGYSGEILWDSNYPDGALRRVLDTTRAERAFGFRARIDLRDGLRETVEWYRTMRHKAAAREEARMLASPA